MRAGCASALSADGYALPIDRALIDANPSMLDQPHHDYPAIDLMVPEGSPVYAVRGGTVARVVEWPFNCWEVGHCEQTCGVGLSIDGDDGSRYIYCHGSRLNGIEVGDTVDRRPAPHVVRQHRKVRRAAPPLRDPSGRPAAVPTGPARRALRRIRHHVAT